MMILCNLLQDIPDKRLAFFNKSGGIFNIVDIAILNKATDNEWFKEFQSHHFWYPTLIKVQIRADDNYRTTGVVNSFAQKILPKSPLFPANHIRKRSKLPLPTRRVCHLTFASRVIYQGINCFLKHSLFISAYN